jgi:hypothetical protein
MSHGVRLFNDLFYQSPNVQPASWWETCDLVLSKALNGDGGGTWTPSAPIIIGGAGMWFGGPVFLSGGAIAVNNSGSGTKFVHGDSDYFQLANGHTGATRTLSQSMGEAIDCSDFTSVMECAAETITTITTTPLSAPRCLIPLFVHDGSAIEGVAFSFGVAVHSFSSPPASMPAFRVYARDALGNIIPLSSTIVEPTLIANGFKPFPTPASGSAWHASGATQTINYLCDTNSVAATRVDRSKYTYWAEIIEETGANSVAGNSYYGMAVTFTAIADQRPQ